MNCRVSSNTFGEVDRLNISQFSGSTRAPRLRDDEAAPAAQARVPVGASPTGWASPCLTVC